MMMKRILVFAFLAVFYSQCVFGSKELKKSFTYLKTSITVTANVETCCQKPGINIRMVVDDLSIDWKGVFQESKNLKTPLTARTMWHQYPGIPVDMKVEMQSHGKGSLSFKATLLPEDSGADEKVVFDWQSVTSDCLEEVNCDRIQDVKCNADDVCTHSFTYKQSKVFVTTKPEACNKNPSVSVHLVVNELSIDWTKTFKKTQSVDTPLTIRTFGFSGPAIKMKVETLSERKKEMSYKVTLDPAGDDEYVVFNWRKVTSDCSDATYGWNSLGLGIQALIGVIIFTVIAIPSIVLLRRLCKRKQTQGSMIYRPMA